MTRSPDNYLSLQVAALAGGVGGAKLARGLDRVLPPGNLTLIVNTGDDFEHFGLCVSPDLDSVCYALAGLADPVRGWGRADETWNCFSGLGELGAPTWFQLGDKDLALHLERTRLLQEGLSLSEVTRHFCERWGMSSRVLPMCDGRFRTQVRIADGSLLDFQEYFVRERCEPVISGFVFSRAEDIAPAPGVLSALEEADLVVLCPSNPWVSIDPILQLPGILEVLRKKTVIAVSPIIQGKSVKGPAAKMFAEMGIAPTSLSVLAHYSAFLEGFVYDLLDRDLFQNYEGERIIIRGLNTLMQNDEDKTRLATEMLRFGQDLIARKAP